MEGELLSDVKKKEEEYSTLKAHVEQLQQGSVPESLVSAGLAQLRAENAKLKYQRNILQNSLATEEARSPQYSVAIARALRSQFQLAVARAFPSLGVAAVPLTTSSSEKFGDYQCNAAMAIAKRLNQQGHKCSPRDVAQSLIDHLGRSSLVSKLEVAGPGFINITLRPEFVLEQISKLVSGGVKPPHVGHQRRVVVDMSSPNIAKEMHVGHLRSTIIGDSLANLCSFVGHDVLKLNHVGDWGTQFGMLIAHLVDQFPNFKEVAPPIADLEAFYKKSKKRFDDDEAFKQRAYAYVVKLQSGDADVRRAWNLICDVSRHEFDKVYSRLDIQQLVERGESFYQDLMDELVRDLQNKGLLEDDEGRKVMFVEGGQIPLTVVKKDGGYTYDTSDLAAVRHRLTEEKADWLLYVVDNGQGVHFDTVFRAARRAQYSSEKQRIEHVGFGVVLGEDGKKFRTRTGETVRLVDLLDEGLARSEAKLLEKGRDKELSPEELRAARDSVAYSCIKYADLSHNRSNDYHFSFDRMLEDTGNTAVYLLYAYMRISSIARAADVTKEQVRSAASGAPLQFKHAAEWRLAKYLLRFSDVILRTLDDLYLHTLCEFLYELSQAFTEFYGNCYCIEKDEQTGEKRVNMDRLVLCEAVAGVMLAGFHILGIQPLSRM